MPAWRQETIDTEAIYRIKPVIEKNGRKLPVNNRRSKRAFNINHLPSVAEKRRIRRECKKAVHDAIMQMAGQLYIEGRAVNCYLADNGTTDGYAAADSLK